MDNRRAAKLPHRCAGIEVIDRLVRDAGGLAVLLAGVANVTDLANRKARRRPADRVGAPTAGTRRLKFQSRLRALPRQCERRPIERYHQARHSTTNRTSSVRQLAIILPSVVAPRLGRRVTWLWVIILRNGLNDATVGNLSVNIYSSPSRRSSSRLKRPARQRNVNIVPEEVDIQGQAGVSYQRRLHTRHAKVHLQLARDDPAVQLDHQPSHRLIKHVRFHTPAFGNSGGMGGRGSVRFSTAIAASTAIPSGRVGFSSRQMTPDLDISRLLPLPSPWNSGETPDRFGCLSYDQDF